MASKLFQLATLATLAILTISLGSTPANALSVNAGSSLVHRHEHAVLAHKKRQTTRRCKARPTSTGTTTTSSSTTTGTTTTTTKAAATTTTKPPAAQAPAATTTTKAPATTAPSNPPATGGWGKVGLAWPNGDQPASLAKFKTSKVNYIYSWSPYKPAGSDSLGLEFIPMLWGWSQTSQFSSLVKGNYAKKALGPNEPDHGEQSAMSPGSAVTLWRQYLQPLKGSGYTLISPAVTSSPAGKTWLQTFVNQCTGCSIDAIAVHWYGTNPNDFIAYLKDFHNTFGRPLYVTEFACQSFSGGAQCSSDQVWNFMRVTTEFMDNTSWVHSYYYFGVMKNMGNVSYLNRLMGDDGAPTALGYEYIN